MQDGKEEVDVGVFAGSEMMSVQNAEAFVGEFLGVWGAA